jgi:hypothetical protein
MKKVKISIFIEILKSLKVISIFIFALVVSLYERLEKFLKI